MTASILRQLVATSALVAIGAWAQPASEPAASEPAASEPAASAPPSAPAMSAQASATSATAPAGKTAGDTATVVQPRAFGHVIGDVLTQRVLLERGGRAVQAAQLPGPAKLGVWFDRGPARLETGADGRRWVVVDYQVINAPAAPAAVALPAWVLPLAGGGAPLQVGALPIGVAPLTPSADADADAAAAAASLRPDHAAPRVDVDTPARRAGLAGVALALVAAAWLGWIAWRRWRAEATRPFARALRELRGHPSGSAGAGSADPLPPAFQALHRAFDRAAGLSVRSATLPALFDRVPWLAPMRPQIEAFYARSAALFFTGAPAPADAAGSLSPLALGRALRSLERRNVA